MCVCNDRLQWSKSFVFLGLTLRRMFETAIGDGANQLGLQKEVAETGGVDADVGTFLVDAVTSRGLSLLAIGRRGGLLGLELLVRVVDQVLLGRHGDGWVWVVVGKVSQGRERWKVVKKETRLGSCSRSR